MLSFAVYFLVGVQPGFWLSDEEFDKKYCQGRLGRVETARNELNLIYGGIAKDPNLANDERVIAFTQRSFELLQREIKDLEKERAEQRLRLLLPQTKARKRLQEPASPGGSRQSLGSQKG